VKEGGVNERRKFIFIFTIVFFSIIFLLFFNQITGNWACIGTECNKANSSTPGTGIYTTIIIIIVVVVLALLFTLVKKAKRNKQP